MKTETHKMCVFICCCVFFFFRNIIQRVGADPQFVASFESGIRSSFLSLIDRPSLTGHKFG